MTHRDFIYWLQGFLEVSGAQTITPEQIKIIKEHIDLAMKNEAAPTVFRTTPQDPLGGGLLSDLRTYCSPDPAASC